MSARSRQYNDMFAACRRQTTAWLEKCLGEPSEGMMRNPVVRLAVRNALKERGVDGYQDIDSITEYGSTCRLSRALRVF